MKHKLILSLSFVALLAASCGKNNPDPTPAPTPDPPAPTPSMLTANKVVAHRGGASECKKPDNSIASLNYAMGLQCYASECDIYWTKDNNVVVAHADGNDKINGLYPWESTVAEIRAAGTLSNGEQVPVLSDFLDIVMTQNYTRLWLDIKNITNTEAGDANQRAQYAINAVKKACDIIKEKNAAMWCEFICTGNAKVMAGVTGKTTGSAFGYATEAGIPIAWMSNSKAEEYAQKGYVWANLSDEYMTRGGGSRTIDEFAKYGIKLSVFVVDSKEQINYYTAEADRLKAICSNYPSAVINALAAAGK